MKINEFYIGDNLELLKSVEDCSVQMVYLDPPYNTGRDFSDFDDKFSSISNYAYEFLEPRFKEIKRILNIILKYIICFIYQIYII
jgi:site-specific DNA-methyltransferase (adenine-specific)